MRVLLAAAVLLLSGCANPFTADQQAIDAADCHRLSMHDGGFPIILDVDICRGRVTVTQTNFTISWTEFTAQAFSGPPCQDKSMGVGGSGGFHPNQPLSGGYAWVRRCGATATSPDVPMPISDHYAVVHVGDFLEFCVTGHPQGGRNLSVDINVPGRRSGAVFWFGSLPECP